MFSCLAIIQACLEAACAFLLLKGDLTDLPLLSSGMASASSIVVLLLRASLGRYYPPKMELLLASLIICELSSREASMEAPSMVVSASIDCIITLFLLDGLFYRVQVDPPPRAFEILVVATLEFCALLRSTVANLRLFQLSVVPPLAKFLFLVPCADWLTSGETKSESCMTESYSREGRQASLEKSVVLWN